MRAICFALALLALTSPVQADELRAPLPIACAASLGQQTPFTAASWRKDMPGLAMTTVEPFDMQLLTRGQHRIKIRSPRMRLALRGKGPQALLASRLYPAQISAENLLKTALRRRASSQPITAFHRIMEGRAVPHLIANINTEIEDFGFEITEIDFSTASFRIWERTCRKQSQ